MTSEAVQAWASEHGAVFREIGEATGALAAVMQTAADVGNQHGDGGPP